MAENVDTNKRNDQKLYSLKLRILEDALANGWCRFVTKFMVRFMKLAKLEKLISDYIITHIKPFFFKTSNTRGCSRNDCSQFSQTV